jgi:ribosomal protein S17E
MEVKGTYIKAISLFVKNNYPDMFYTWIKNLPDVSEKIHNNTILINQFYPLKEAASIPIYFISKMFYNGNIATAAKDVGRFHADFALKGVYKLFLILINPHLLVKSASKIYSKYYSESEYVILYNKNKKAVSQIRNYPEKDIISETSMGAYTKRGLELAGANNVTAKKTKSFARGDEVIEYVFEWE